MHAVKGVPKHLGEINLHVLHLPLVFQYLQGKTKNESQLKLFVLYMAGLLCRATEHWMRKMCRLSSPGNVSRPVPEARTYKV